MADTITITDASDIKEAKEYGVPIEGWGSLRAFKASLDVQRELEINDKIHANPSAKSRALDLALQRLKAKIAFKRQIAMVAQGYFVDRETGKLENIFENMRKEGEKEAVIEFYEHIFMQLGKIEMQNLYRGYEYLTVCDSASP